MIMALLDALALVWIMAREQEDPEDGEERIYTSSVASGDTFPSRGRHDRGEAVA